MKEHRLSVLFVCSRNQWRSPTAERIFSQSPRLQPRARGLSASAKRRLTAADVVWADAIFVMETRHKQQLLQLFGEEARGRPVHVLDIPDDYEFMAPELVALIEAGVREALGAGAS